jgi:hypothetical protein
MALSVEKRVLAGVYENHEQARQRLRGSVVLYDGRPHYVHETNEGLDGRIRITLGELPYAVHGSIPENPVVTLTDDPLLNRFRPFETGFMNMFETGRNETAFVFRRPVRQSQQGFNGQSYSSKLLHGSLGTRDAGAFESVIASPSFAEMVRGIYPSFEECMDALIPSSSVGFDRNYAVRMDSDGTVWLYRQQIKVGIVSKSPNRLLLFRSKRYLREEFQESESLPNIEMEI